MTLEFSFHAHLYTARFNDDWSVTTNTYSFQDITITVPEAEPRFFIPADGQLDGTALEDHEMHYLGLTGSQSVFLGNDNPASISRVTHGSDLTTDILQFDIHVRTSDGTVLGFDTIYIALAGDPLPVFATPEEFDAWRTSATGWWTAPTSGPFAGGETAGWADFDIPSEILGTDGNDRLDGTPSADTIRGGDGSDTINGGDGDDFLFGGDTEADLRDVIFAGEGNDSVDAGYGNDLVYGMGGNDTIAGGFGVDELQGQDGDDVITGSAFSDLVYGGAGDDFVNGGYGHDRINGGTGADKFFHVGASGHGSDWVQDYSAAEGDVLLFGIGSATRDQFQVNFNHTQNAAGERAGDDAVQEAFVIYRPTGQIMWALVDGEGQSSINLQIGADVFDLLA
ncbi:calcium-binding protein [Ruegeria sp. PrR005]|uniref:Calcium-binding protein n=1 Tax=Ruegeria sp. PrR005 TaxID=2706882 RepID=A0A6B2NM18_9RHOB|nr:calcium-binding protein [Ruegeria sp. PrR005]NDW45096.1 calcium-binding protein [Ruegeria sp. PrR005]